MPAEDKIDLEALQESIDDSQVDDNIDVDQETDNQDDEQQIDDFNLDNALDSFEPIELDGKITDDEATAKAKERGWNENGKDKYGHSVSAIEFLERTPLFHKMDLMRGDITEQNNKINKLLEQNKLIAKKSIDHEAKLVADFKKEKEQLLNQEILDSDDITNLKDIDKKIESHTVVEKTVDQGDIAERYEVAKTEFVNSNDWYQTDYAMTTLADNTGLEYAKGYYEKNGVMPEPEETFKVAMDAVKNKFPDMGKPQRQTRVASRTNRTVTSNRRPKKTINDLPEDQRAVARMVMEAADLTEDQYLKDYEV